MANVIRSIKGTRDFYPSEMVKRQWLIGHMRAASEAFGYQPYDGPCLETLELYAAKSGEELVKEQAFVFEDRGGDPVTLRPELTPTLARMVAEKENELFFPLRWWSFGPFWRYERPQKGRTREFFQWNIDLIGSESLLADAELIAVAATFLRNVGLKPQTVQLLVNDRRLMEKQVRKLGIASETLPDLLRMIDRLDRQPGHVWDEKVLGLGLNREQLKGIRELLGNKELWRESEELSTVFTALQELGVGEYVSYDPKIIRGLDYYTGIVFEAHDTKDEFRAILGGGRYANLVGDVGGKPLPGVGFAMGDVVINLVLEKYNLIPQHLENSDGVFVTIFDETTWKSSLELAAELRGAGIEATVYPDFDKLAKQLKYADRMGFTKAVVVGPEELVKGEVVVKDLISREQITLDHAKLIELLKNRFVEKLVVQNQPNKF